MNHKNVKIVIGITVFLLLFLSLVPVTPAANSQQKVDQVTSGRPEGVFKLLTYNIWETGRNLTWIDVVKEENPDIAVFVETGKWSPTDGTFDEVLNDLNALNPNEKPYVGYTTQAVSSTDGEAVISRYPIKQKIQVSELTLDDGTKIKPAHDFIDVVVDIYGTEVHVVGTHLACCDGGFSSRLKDQEGIMNYFDSLGDVPIIYAGDFNSHSPEDIGDIGPNDSNLGTEPIALMLNSSDPRSSKIHTFTDVYRTLNPYSPGFTYVDKQYQSRIDYTFVNQHLIETLVNSTVVTTEAGLNGADHRPILSTFNMRYTEFDLRPPLQVKGFTATKVDTGIQFSWEGNTEDDMFKYQIWRSQCLITELDKDSVSFTDTSTDPNALYEYSIVPVDINKNFGSPRTIIVNSSYGQIQKPGTPVLNATSFSGRIELKWTSEPNGAPIIYTSVMRSIYPDTGFIQVALVNGNEYNETGIRAGVQVYFKVKTFNIAGSSPVSNTVSGKILNSPSLDTTNNYIITSIPEASLTTQVECPAPLNIIDFPTSSESSSSQLTTSNQTTTEQTTTESTIDEPPTSSETPVFFGGITLIVAIGILFKKKRLRDA